VTVVVFSGFMSLLQMSGFERNLYVIKVTHAGCSATCLIYFTLLVEKQQIKISPFPLTAKRKQYLQ